MDDGLIELTDAQFPSEHNKLFLCVLTFESNCTFKDTVFIPHFQVNSQPI